MDYEVVEGGGRMIRDPESSKKAEDLAVWDEDWTRAIGDCESTVLVAQDE